MVTSRYIKPSGGLGKSVCSGELKFDIIPGIVKNPPDITRPFRQCIIPGLFAILCCLAAMAALPRPLGATVEDQANFLRLKERFETLAQRHSDPVILACLAVETTAQAWTLAAARLTEDPIIQAQWKARAAGFEKSWSSAGWDWDTRHRRALRVYYEAFSDVARKVAGVRTDGRRNDELAAVLEKADKALAALSKRSPDAYLEREALSHGLMSLASIVIHSSDHRLGRPAGLILEAVDEAVDDLRHRKGLHYRARLSFIYTAQVQGLTDLIFLLSQTAGPPLSRPLAEIQAALDRAGADPRLPITLSLLWTAQAQASLPLAYWLSTRPRAGQGKRP
jgi:hypothetical protein